MSWKQIGYWGLTGLFCLAMGMAGVMNLIRFEPQQQAMVELGYPVYLMSILGVAKVLGVLALLAPRLPLLKEWAYAGFTFDLLGAAASHAFAGHSPVQIVVPLVMLVVAGGSYLLRPADRRGAVHVDFSEVNHV